LFFQAEHSPGGDQFGGDVSEDGSSCGSCQMLCAPMEAEEDGTKMEAKQEEELAEAQNEELKADNFRDSGATGAVKKVPNFGQSGSIFFIRLLGNSLEPLNDDDFIEDSYVPEKETDDEDYEEEGDDEDVDDDLADEDFVLSKVQVKMEANEEEENLSVTTAPKRGPGRPRKNEKKRPEPKRTKRPYTKSGKPRK
jgi:hypothetical protein